MDDIEYLQQENKELKAKNALLRKKVFELQVITINKLGNLS
jgi:cell division septum initiation protein DivIVA